MTLEQAVQQAERNEPTFAAAVAESRATALERKDARAALLPSAVYHNQFLFTESNHSKTTLQSGTFSTQGSVQQSLPVFIANNTLHEYYSQVQVNETLGFAQAAAVRQADANALRAAAELEIARRGLIAVVVNLYFSVGAEEQKILIAREALDEADRFLDITRKREEGREAAHADVLKAQLQQQGRDRELADARLLSEKARLELGILLFPDPAVPYTVAPAQAPPELPERGAAELAAKTNSPELRSAFASLEAGRAAAFGAEAALLPDLALNFTYGIDAPQFAAAGPDGVRNLGYSAGATLDLPVWDWLTTERRVKEARIRADAARTALTQAQRRLLADFNEYFGEASVARAQLASLDGSVGTARESLRLTNLRYVDGESTVLEVVDAQNTLILAETAQIDGTVRYRLALAQLETLTGSL